MSFDVSSPACWMIGGGFGGWQGIGFWGPTGREWELQLARSLPHVEIKFSWLRIHAACVQHFRLGLAGRKQHQAAASVVDFDDAVRRAGGVPGEDRFHRLHGGDGLPVGGEVVVGELAGRGESSASLGGRAAEFDGRHFADEPLEHFDAVAALRALAPRLEERAVVVIVDR